MRSPAVSFGLDASRAPPDCFDEGHSGGDRVGHLPGVAQLLLMELPPRAWSLQSLYLGSLCDALFYRLLSRGAAAGGGGVPRGPQRGRRRWLQLYGTRACESPSGPQRVDVSCLPCKVG